MYESVRESFIKITTSIDGMYNHMYCDLNRRVRGGLGVPLPSRESAQMISWRWNDTNKKATAKEIAAEWQAIYFIGQQGADGRGPEFFARYSQIHLPNTEMYRTALDRLLRLEKDLLDILPENYTTWPADAQMAVLQIALEQGVNVFAKGTDLHSDLKALNFNIAKTHIGILKPAREELVNRLLSNAAEVLKVGAIKSKLWNEKTPFGDESPKLVK